MCLLERVKLCKILNPFIFLIMFIDHWQFNDLVQIEYKVDNHNRQFQDKCADASQRNNDTPQSYRITQHSKFGVSAYLFCFLQAVCTKTVSHYDTACISKSEAEAYNKIFGNIRYSIGGNGQITFSHSF